MNDIKTNVTILEMEGEHLGNDVFPGLRQEQLGVFDDGHVDMLVSEGFHRPAEYV